jgi:hypothetical protein
MKKFFFLIVVLYSAVSFCQVDSLDTIFLVNGKQIKGKVIMIKSNLVEFVEPSTSIIYEYDKAKIDSVILSSGKVIDFTIPRSLTTKQVEELEEMKIDTIGVQVELGGGVLLAFKSNNYNGATGGNLLLELRTKSIFAIRADYA